VKNLKTLLIIFIAIKQRLKRIYRKGMDMESTDYKIIAFDPITISEEYIEKFLDLDDRALKEMDPEDDPYPHELHKKMIQAKDPGLDTYRWLLVTNNESVFGYCCVTFVTPQAENYQNAKNTASIEIYIDERYRRKGFGTKLLKIVLEKIKHKNTAKKQNHRVSDSSNFVSILQARQVTELGYNFCEKFKGTIIQEEAEYRTYLSTIDWELVKTWKEEGELLAKQNGTKLMKFQSCPEGIIVEYCKLYTETLNQRPLGDIDIRHQITPKYRRDHEKMWIEERGHKWHTIVSIESDGTLSGLTEMVYIPETPTYIEQLLTGVRKNYREKGLGKWLKAEMALFIKQQYPKIQFILTENADMNDAMLSINSRMNFQQVHAFKTYSFDIGDLIEMLY
jgi:GNAT superfamily N-acetyltransferase